jgi:L-ribulose-5-phosphate 3-epimerase
MSCSIGVNTYGYIWTTPWEACLRRLAALGYGEFELVVNPPHLPLDADDAAHRRAAAQALRDEGVVVRSVNLPSLDANLASPLAQAREYSVHLFRQAIDLAADLGAEHLITVPGRVNPLLAPSVPLRVRWLEQTLGALIPHAQARGVGLALENVPFASLPDAKSLCAFVRSIGSPVLSVCYDVANAHFIGESPAAGLREAAGLVRVVHLSDTTRSAWRHAEVGKGDVPFAEIAGALEETGYEGPCMLEIIEPDPESAIVRSHRALADAGFARVAGGSHA